VGLDCRSRRSGTGVGVRLHSEPERFHDCYKYNGAGNEHDLHRLRATDHHAGHRQLDVNTVDDYSV